MWLLSNIALKLPRRPKFSSPEVWDNSLIEDLTMATLLDKLIALRQESEIVRLAIDDIIADEKLKQPASTPAQPQQYAPTPAPGLMQNPYKGLITDVVAKPLPSKTKPGTTFMIYEVVTGAGKFGTFDVNLANMAVSARDAGTPLVIHWKPRPNGKHLNYDVVGISQG